MPRTCTAVSRPQEHSQAPRLGAGSGSAGRGRLAAGAARRCAAAHDIKRALAQQPTRQRRAHAAARGPAAHAAVGWRLAVAVGCCRLLRLLRSMLLFDRRRLKLHAGTSVQQGCTLLPAAGVLVARRRAPVAQRPAGRRRGCAGGGGCRGRRCRSYLGGHWLAGVDGHGLHQATHNALHCRPGKQAGRQECTRAQQRRHAGRRAALGERPQACMQRRRGAAGPCWRRRPPRLTLPRDECLPGGHLGRVVSQLLAHAAHQPSHSQPVLHLLRSREGGGEERRGAGDAQERVRR